MLERASETNDTLMKEDLILSEEVREISEVRDGKAKLQRAKQYNKRVLPREFEVGDLVLRRADIGLKNAREGKLARNWEGSYRVSGKIGAEGYQIETLSGCHGSKQLECGKAKSLFQLSYPRLVFNSLLNKCYL
ncbi:MAG: hypothetical protein Q8877_02690 [Sweet potato little leaf phytoplasma]|nr:hypothetical protein [Sweet potato little leaf phytoplasma]